MTEWCVCKQLLKIPVLPHVLNYYLLKRDTPYQWTRFCKRIGNNVQNQFRKNLPFPYYLPFHVSRILNMVHCKGLTPWKAWRHSRVSLTLDVIHIVLNLDVNKQRCLSFLHCPHTTIVMQFVCYRKEIYAGHSCPFLILLFHTPTALVHAHTSCEFAKRSSFLHNVCAHHTTDYFLKYITHEYVQEIVYG